SSVQRVAAHGLLGRAVVDLVVDREGLRVDRGRAGGGGIPRADLRGARAPHQPPRRQARRQRVGAGGRLGARRQGHALGLRAGPRPAARVGRGGAGGGAGMTTRPAATLVLEDGAVFRGEAFASAPFTVAGEVVFTTAMSGYQEVLTDPSYRRQLVCMAAPEVGNYGVTPGDAESGRAQVAAFLVRQAARRPSSWRAT